MPKVSIVMRLKNEQEFLPLVLEALTKQTFKDFEVIAVDNQSTDKTSVILKEFSDALKITVVNLPANDFTYSYACNLGVERSSGEIVGFLSGHSLPVLNDYVASGVQHFSDQKVAGVFGPVLPSEKASFSERIFYTMGMGYKLALKLCLSSKSVSLTRPRIGLLGNTNSFIRRSLWEEYPFSELLSKGGEDTGWAIHFMKLGYKIIREPRMVVEHSHGDNLLKLIKQNVSWYRMYKRALEVS